ncbi:MAG TPA: UDP-N-acetylmuramoyl-L-alanyl-D-glutamate--2,6-diaminopimelate ligase [Mariprofundaceae bacterium]|nr:UDP-N-acetylmuramoyl-L-alanyl-D-glutamate--2,6-diaminopimelate ligase [Mariprofundaceae bacterium]
MNNLPDLIAMTPRPAARLAALADGIAPVRDDAEITGIRDDSRSIEPGEAFLCLPRATDPGRYLDVAAERGAAAAIVIGNRPVDTRLPLLQLHTMDEAGRLLRRWFGTEKTAVRCIGITGTDGKTSVAWMLRQALGRAGRRCWSIGTLGWIRHDDDILDIGNTTPSLLTMHRLLYAADRQGIDTIVAEVSSHGIAQGRIAGIDMAAAVWTSIGHDHLQDHGGFDSYANTKAGFMLDSLERGAVAIANADYAEIRRRLDADVRWYGHGLYRSDVALGWEQELPGMVRLKCRDQEVLIEDIPFGDFHAENVACTATVLTHALDMPTAGLASMLGGVSAPPGRMQAVNIGRWQVFVDYAHTPEALEKCLQSARKMTRKRLCLVFGCGGERDREKRPQMGEIAVRLADAVWITSDNPRDERPELIASEIENGMPKPYRAEVHLQLDRRQAIADAIAQLEAGDALVIAGKGHESYMEIAGKKRLPWSDVDIAAEYLHAKNGDEGLKACA